MEFFTPLSDKDALSLNALVLAYVGDAVQSLYVREQLVQGVQLKTDSLHKLATCKVKAATQAQLADKLMDCFTENEKSVFLRGRNSKAHHKAKNQTTNDYRKATGLEAVFGYLYLTGQSERLKQLLEVEL